MIVVASANGAEALEVAWTVLEDGGSALDAVEAAARVVEDDPRDHSVGTGGYPNLLGQVELDASIMEGTTRRFGGVAALQGFRHPISVARAVMERLPHVLVVGAGAASLAAELGAETAELLTPEAEAAWRDGLARSPAGLTGAVLAQVQALSTNPEHVAGTVDFLALDRDGHIASAVSTSGWAWKWPGRVGDSPIPGAGNYCDDRFGAAACTGFGELALRTQTARTVVNGLASGLDVAAAGRAALEDLFALGEPADRIVMNTVALDRNGNHAGLTTEPGARYAWRDESSGGVQLATRIVVRPDPA